MSDTLQLFGRDFIRGDPVWFVPNRYPIVHPVSSYDYEREALRNLRARELKIRDFDEDTVLLEDGTVISQKTCYACDVYSDNLGRIFKDKQAWEIQNTRQSMWNAIKMHMTMPMPDDVSIAAIAKAAWALGLPEEKFYMLSQSQREDAKQL